MEDLVPLKIANLVENVISYEVDKRAVMHIEQSALYHLNYRIQVTEVFMALLISRFSVWKFSLFSGSFLYAFADLLGIICTPTRCVLGFAFLCPF